LNQATNPPPADGAFLVFSDDWGRHPSSCQHLISHLLPKHPVFWVNTIGMRPPTLDMATWQRGMEKCKHWLKRRRSSSPASTETSENPTVLNPRMWPWFKRAHDRWLNKYLLTKPLQNQIASIEGPVIAITTIPIVSDLMDQLPVTAWVYYCVDDFGLWPGLDQRTMATMESSVIQKADCCIAASKVLQDRLRQVRPDVELLTHGVDMSHWALTADASGNADTDQERYAATFWGLMDQRLDAAVVRAVATAVDGTIAFVGPQDNPPPEILSLENSQAIPPVPYQELPAVAANSDVLIMPYADLPVTRAMQPLKLLEYLATFKPVVVRDLPANRAWADCLDIANEPEEFAALVVERRQTGLPDAQRQARQRLVAEDWHHKARRFEQIILDHSTHRNELRADH